jgi:amidase
MGFLSASLPLAVPFSDLLYYDAMGLAELVRARQITPLEIVEDTIRKIESINPKLNAIVHKTYDRARQQAAAVAHGPFAGVPFLVKDNATVAGVRLTRGSRALRGDVPVTSAPFFAAAENAGFILLGVTNMPEMGLIDGTENALYGPTRNPWNLDYSPGGSSGGAAACVAAGVLPLAHGTDGGGSIRIPASHCGLFGLKASRGRVLPGNFASSAWPRLVDGCLSRSVRDTAMYLSAVEDPNAKFCKLGYVSGKSARRLKIAVTYEGMLGQEPHPAVRDAIADTAQLCRQLGHVIDEARPLLDQAKLSETAQQLGAVEVAQAVDGIAKTTGLTRLEDGFESRALGLREEAMRKGPFDRQIAGALPILQAGTAKLDQFFQEWDVLLTPVVRTPVFRIGMRDQTKFSFQALEAIVHDYATYPSLHNICGTTAMSVPLHWDHNGLPLGSQFAARMGAEATLLALAYELEEARPWASIDHAWGARSDARGDLPKPPSSYLKKIYVDTVVFTPEQLAALVATFGIDHVLMGTDYPYDMAEYDPLQHIAATTSLDATARAALAGGNAKKLLGM